MFNSLIRKTGCIFTLILCILLFSCHVVKHGTKEDAAIKAEFDPVLYVAENWDSRIMPEILDKAMDLEFVISRLRADRSQAEKELGVQKEETQPFNFMVKGVFPVRSLDRTSAAGILILDLPDVSGDSFCRVQIGPVFKGSMVRDSLSFIHFNDFPGGQVPFGAVSREINFHIRDNITNIVDDSFSAGKMVELMGVCVCDKSGGILITPVAIKLVPGADNG